ncbi:DUF4880 domain-containing protein [Trinickia caryophylli]|nr:DUF4880 domain-containing protein [Trinickia caryophylli]TRX20411.1 DUF4880 domain-containing protein [Trinickia caryophylli]
MDAQRAAAERAADDALPLSRAVAREAAAWLVRLHGGGSREDEEACRRWRAADAEHERAWQRALRLTARLDAVPASVGMPVLGRSVRTTRRTTVKALSLMLAAGPIGYAAYRATPWREWAADERTTIGERRSVTLADGSRVDLDTATAFDIRFGDGERRLTLYAGAIQVTTGSDAGHARPYRPLVVQTAQGMLRALGTRFVVRDDGSAGTFVAVLHGAVEAATEAAPLKRIVPAGRQLRFTASSIGEAVPVDPHVADWAHGTLFAERMRLADFLSELSRYRPGLLRCDPSVADLRISGVFRLDRADDILAALPQTLPVRIVSRTRYWIGVTAAGI